MGYDEAIAVVKLLVPEDQLVLRARQISSAGRPLGCVRTNDQAIEALAHLVRETVARIEDDWRRSHGWKMSNRYPFALQPPE